LPATTLGRHRRHIFVCPPGKDDAMNEIICKVLVLLILATSNHRAGDHSPEVSIDFPSSSLRH